MYNDKAIKKAKSFIFSKKLSGNKMIPLNKVKNILGPMRYFPPTNQEWSNSIYVYNGTTIKNINNARKNLTSLINSYFNMYFSKKLLAGKRILTRFRRLTISKIFISKVGLKYTSDKIIINLYVYNEERRILLNRLKTIETLFFPNYSTDVNRTHEDFSFLFSMEKRLNLIIKEEPFSFITWLEKVIYYIKEEIKLERKYLEKVNNHIFREEKILKIKSLEESLKRILFIMSSCENNSFSLKYYQSIYEKFLNKAILEREITIIAYYKLLLSLNKSKFKDFSLSQLGLLINKIYNKQVEFNIINLKAIYLNSDIFTQAISLKLRDRNNKLLKVLKLFLYMVKLPKVNLLKERFGYIDIKNLWENKVRNLTINYPVFKHKTDNIDYLLTNLLIKSDFSKSGLDKKLKMNKDKGDKTYKEYKTTLNASIIDHILTNLKHKNMAGIRLEAKGRLTRRFTASRSVFKIKWKGSLKNIDSSYKGLSSVILRGYIKSNVQYSIINSKTRNGAFGLKGWISGK